VSEHDDARREPEHPQSATEPAPDADARPWYLRPQTYLIGALGIVAAGIFVAGMGFWTLYSSAEIPAPDELRIPDPTVVVDAAGDEVQTFAIGAVRRNVVLGDLPEHVPQAVLAAEDRGFYSHGGFSVSGILRAAWANIRHGEVKQGASTVTQQYVGLAIEDIERSYVGKVREIALAARLDREMEKDQILEMYLNSVPLGRTADGIEAGARTYFGVSATELSLEQAAVLAGMIAAPTAFDPEKNPEDAALRRDFVLQGMVDMGVLDQATADEHIGTELPELNIQPLFQPGPEAYFLDAIRDLAPTLVGDDVAIDSGLVIHTTLDRRAQQLAIDTLNAQLGETPYSGAVVTVDPASGAVRALVGGRDYGSQEFNVAVEGLNQVGSSFKVFALAEFVRQGYHPDATDVDAPKEYDVDSEPGETHTVTNYSGDGYGEIDVREATVNSVNTAYVRLAEELGYDAVVDMARTLGVDVELAPYPSTILGSADLRPIDMAEAYATLAADGVHHEPYLIERIETQDGEVLFEHDPKPEQVIEPQVARVVSDVLADVIRSGTGTAADIGRPAAGKTGTTNEYRDAWFVGYTPQAATAVWVGTLDNSPMDRVSGGSLPAAIWGVYMTQYVEPFPVAEFESPDPDGLQPLEGLEAPEPLPPPPPPPPPPEPEKPKPPKPDDGDKPKPGKTDADDDD
jgi:penicillin-binding protein 1A